MDLDTAQHLATGRAVYSDGTYFEAPFGNGQSERIDRSRLVRFELRAGLVVVQSWEVSPGWRLVTRLRVRQGGGTTLPVLLVALESHDRSVADVWTFELHEDGTKVTRRDGYGTDWLSRAPVLVDAELV